ncbi:hypothetical protein EW026_g2453 [Hermanssonia centrifuga]|uniref:NAD(+) diphosphatase n=1 Tax=Hermanssonia centrifuga TaxID=98765 RepID=A0A4S4KSU8_9APHY|nr:hypothetical protein EW026_g2453 [Hermanssonia centrifuga]
MGRQFRKESMPHCCRTSQPVTPRTDPVVIMAVVNEVNDRILLSRNRKWPGKFYSALAGFVEPGGSFEDAVKRELWKEVGLKVWGIQYHSTQPWPFPANLMIGFYAIADPALFSKYNFISIPGDLWHTNFFAGTPLNRLAWLRTSPSFLNADCAVVGSPATRWVLFNEGKPLMSSSGSNGPHLARLSTAEVKPLLGPEPFFSQSQQEGELAKSDEKVLQAARLHGPPIVFLGLYEHEDASGSSRALPSSDFSVKKDVAEIVSNIHGTPYFSLDVTEIQETKVNDVLGGSQQGRDGVEFEFIDGRAAMGNLSQFDSGVFSEARFLVDWSARNKYCAGCGSPVYTLWAG